MIFSLFSSGLKGQFFDHSLGQQVFRSGQILDYQKEVNGRLLYQAKNATVNNVIYNLFYEHAGVYSRIDLSLIPLVAFNQNQNQHWSYNLCLGAYFNEDDQPLELGPVSLFYGLGVDLDLSTYIIDKLNGERVSFESGSIGLNLRVDMKIGEYLIVKNSITRGWWRPDQLIKWDIRSLINLKITNGLYLTAAPNYQFSSSERDEDSALVRERSNHFYLSYGICTIF